MLLLSASSRSDATPADACARCHSRSGIVRCCLQQVLGRHSQPLNPSHAGGRRPIGPINSRRVCRLVQSECTASDGRRQGITGGHSVWRTRPPGQPSCLRRRFRSTAPIVGFVFFSPTVYVWLERPSGRPSADAVSDDVWQLRLHHDYRAPAVYYAVSRWVLNSLSRCDTTITIRCVHKISGNWWV